MEKSIITLSKTIGKKLLRMHSANHKLMLTVPDGSIALELEHAFELYDAIQDYFGEEIADSGNFQHANNNWRLLSRFDWAHLPK